jgi:hypothetical protein
MVLTVRSKASALLRNVSVAVLGYTGSTPLSTRENRYAQGTARPAKASGRDR